MSDSFGNFDLSKNPAMSQAVDRCKLVSSGGEWCALLAGGFGNGKTHLAIAAMQAFGMERSIFWKVPDFLSWLRARVYDDGLLIDDVLRAYRQSPILLVLDDLGAENPTDWSHEQLYRVLDSRYESRLPTIITTNTRLAQLDQRIMSRYAAGLVVCSGLDWRRI